MPLIYVRLKRIKQKGDKKMFIDEIKNETDVKKLMNIRSQLQDEFISSGCMDDEIVEKVKSVDDRIKYLNSDEYQLELYLQNESVVGVAEKTVEFSKDTTDKKDTRKWVDKETGETLSLTGDYLQAMDVWKRCDHSRLKKYSETDKTDKTTDDFRGFVAYDWVFSELPMFTEPVSKDHNKKQTELKLSKCLFLLKHFSHHFNWTGKTFISTDEYKDKTDIYIKKDREREDREEDNTFVNTIKITSEMDLVEIDFPVCYGQVCTNDSYLLDYFDNTMDISRRIKDLIEIGCMSVKSDSYEIGRKSKSYFFFRNNIQKFYDYCTEMNIPEIVEKTQKEMFDEYVFSDSENPISYESVKVGKGLNIPVIQKPGLSQKRKQMETEMLCLSHLYRRYPEINETQRIYPYLEKMYYISNGDKKHPLCPTSRFTFHYNDKGDRITKIGYRETNMYASVPKETTLNKRVRKDVLKDYGLTYEYDVKSSIPRIAYLLNKGEWLDETIDIYQLIFNRYKEITDTAYVWDKWTRNLMKEIVLTNGFDTLSCCGRDFCNRLNVPGKTELIQSISDQAQIMHSAIVDVIGEIDSEMFVTESAIYNRVLYRLLDRGYFVWQVYDGFYIDEKPDFDMSELIRDTAEEYVSLRMVC